MNYYKHHIGDYAKKTGELTLMEHGAYLLMLHSYYGTEKPLPMGDRLYRMLRALTKAERAAVDSVVTQFWTETKDGLVNGRAFEEIGSATELIEIARQNGKGGGRPKKPSGIAGGLSENNPAGLILEPSGKALQVPGSRFQEVKKNPKSSEDRLETVAEREKGAEAMRRIRENLKHPAP